MKTEESYWVSNEVDGEVNVKRNQRTSMLGLMSSNPQVPTSLPHFSPPLCFLYPAMQMHAPVHRNGNDLHEGKAVLHDAEMKYKDVSCENKKNLVCTSSRRGSSRT